MAFDENLAARIRTNLARKKGIAEKKMFGGIGFLLNGNMLVGVWKDSLIVCTRSIECIRFCIRFLVKPAAAQKRIFPKPFDGKGICVK